MEFFEGKVIDLGVTALSEDQIMEFARTFDPLDFHISKAAAAKSFFGRLIASGPHIFTEVHRTKWLPLFKDTIVCGMGINNWRFLKPVYPDQPIHAYATMTRLQLNPNGKMVSVWWRYEFKDKENELVQHLEVQILHKNS